MTDETEAMDGGQARRVALEAREGGGVARAVLAAAVAVGLMGCDELRWGYPQEIMTDADGCKWSMAVNRQNIDGPIAISGRRLLTPDGKPMCGAP